MFLLDAEPAPDLLNFPNWFYFYLYYNSWNALVETAFLLSRAFLIWWYDVYALTELSENNLKEINGKGRGSGNVSSNGGEKKTETDESGKNQTPYLKIFTLAELKSATRNFRPDTMLGEGGFGRVFKGWVDEKTYAPTKVSLGIPVAVKKSNPESEQGLKEWQVSSNCSFFILFNC